VQLRLIGLPPANAYLERKAFQCSSSLAWKMIRSQHCTGYGSSLSESVYNMSQALPIKNNESAIPEINRNNPKQLSDRLMIVLVASIASFPPLSTDLYLPALPSMSEQLHCSVPLVNLSLVVFFIFLSISSIFWGPLSDKYGRKPVLLTGVILYIVFSGFCVFSQSIVQLIIARIFQAVGAGAAMAVTLAIVKDVFPGMKRERTLALVSVLNGVIPVIAPSIGAQILKLTSWRGIFGAFAFIGTIVCIFVLYLKETNATPSVLSVCKTTLRLFVVLKNPNFIRLIGVFSVISIPILGFISVSSFIFIRRFGISEYAFGFYFGAISSLFIVGGPIYLFLQKYFRPLSIITVCYFGSLVSGILILIIGNMGPMWFAISIALGYLCVSISRPPSSSLLLEQQDSDTGSASSLITASFVMLGSIGMLIVSYEWSNRIAILGLLNLSLGTLGLALWLYTKKRCKIPNHF
jgi:MFS transporter, DHA1 family, multidrug resistance protein